MDLKKRLNQLERLWPVRVRDIGHTKLMIEGMAHFEGPFLLVAATRERAEKIACDVRILNPKAEIIIRGLDEPPLRGQTALPQAIDNSALLQFLMDTHKDLLDAHRRIETLERKR